MAKSIKASLYHVASSDEKPQHHLCPERKVGVVSREIQPPTSTRIVFLSVL
jgi:hypothetical protein